LDRRQIGPEFPRKALQVVDAARLGGSEPRRQAIALPPPQHDQEVLGDVDRRGDGDVLGRHQLQVGALLRGPVRGAAQDEGGDPPGRRTVGRGQRGARPVVRGRALPAQLGHEALDGADGMGEALGADLPPQHRRHPAALLPAGEEVGLVGFQHALLAVDAVPLALGRAFAQVLIHGHPGDADRASDGGDGGPLGVEGTRLVVLVPPTRHPFLGRGLRPFTPAFRLGMTPLALVDRIGPG
jgi:hypothetical protein